MHSPGIEIGIGWHQRRNVCRSTSRLQQPDGDPSAGLYTASRNRYDVTKRRAHWFVQRPVRPQLPRPRQPHERGNSARTWERRPALPLLPARFHRTDKYVCVCVCVCVCVVCVCVCIGRRGECSRGGGWLFGRLVNSKEKEREAKEKEANRKEIVFITPSLHSAYKQQGGNAKYGFSMA